MNRRRECNEDDVPRACIDIAVDCCCCCYCRCCITINRHQFCIDENKMHTFMVRMKRLFGYANRMSQTRTKKRQRRQEKQDWKGKETENWKGISIQLWPLAIVSTLFSILHLFIGTDWGKALTRFSSIDAIDVVVVFCVETKPISFGYLRERRFFLLHFFAFFLSRMVFVVCRVSFANVCMFVGFFCISSVSFLFTFSFFVRSFSILISHRPYVAPHFGSKQHFMLLMYLVRFVFTLHVSFSFVCFGHIFIGNTKKRESQSTFIF